MRVNIYNEELQLDHIELVSTAVGQPKKVFYGIRFVLKTHEDLRPPIHHDDDSSAVTFWADNLEFLRTLLQSALLKL